MKRTAGMAWLPLYAHRLAVAGLALAFFADSVVGRAATLVVTVTQHDGRPLPGAVVTAMPQSMPAPQPLAPVEALVDQVDLAFVPDLVVVPVGSSVSFPNSDAVSHQVYSFSPARRFRLPLYRGKPYPPVVFDQPGIVTLGCNIHDDMLAYVVVTDAPFFGRTDEHGVWKMANVPEGAYRIGLWHPLLKSPTQMVEAQARVGATNHAMELKLDQPLRPPPLSRRPHSWDY